MWKILPIALGLTAGSQRCTYSRVDKNKRKASCWLCLFPADYHGEWSNCHLGSQKKISRPLHAFGLVAGAVHVQGKVREEREARQFY